MACEFAFRDRDRRIQVTARGQVDFRESLAAGVALTKRPDFQPDYNVLVDVREIEFSPSAPEIEDFGRALARFKESFQGRIAVLVEGLLMFGLARMTCSVAEANGFPMRPFTDLEEACAWLEGEDT